jgi:hypothetical protein
MLHVPTASSVKPVTRLYQLYIQALLRLCALTVGLVIRAVACLSSHLGRACYYIQTLLRLYALCNAAHAVVVAACVFSSVYVYS